MDIFKCKPHNDLLSDRGENEAYCTANPGTEYAVYFTNGGEVSHDISRMRTAVRVRWLDIMKSEWAGQTEAEPGGKLVLRCPAEGYWAVLVR